MKIISIRLHGVLDFVTVIAFALFPTVIGLSGVAAQLSYALAVIHLLMTLLTAFPFGVIKAVPIRLHKAVELLVGPLLLVVPWLLGFSQLETERNTYIAAGLVIIVVGALTDYFGHENQ